MLYMLKSVGYAGMVLFMQVASWYFMYFLIGFLAYPLFALEALAACLITIIYFTTVTALLLQCFTRCRRCPQQSGPIVFLIMMVLLCGGLLLFPGFVVGSKWSTSFNASQIVVCVCVCDEWGIPCSVPAMSQHKSWVCYVY